MANRTNNAKHNMMVGFKRSISFSFPTKTMTSRPRELSFQVRSISLPARLNPLAMNLNSRLTELHSWNSAACSPCDGLARVSLLLVAVFDVLGMPQVQEQLRKRSNGRSFVLAECLLDDFLCLADAHGSFLYSVLDLKHHLGATRVALRRGLDVESCIKLQRQAEKEILKLAAIAREVSRPMLDNSGEKEEEKELHELAMVMKDVITAIAAALVAVYSRIVELSTATKAVEAMKFKRVVSMWNLRERACLKQLKGKEMVMVVDEKEKIGGFALEKLEALEDCIAELQRSSEQVFKGLVNIRIVILNVLTPSF